MSKTPAPAGRALSAVRIGVAAGLTALAVAGSAATASPAALSGEDGFGPDDRVGGLPIFIEDVAVYETGPLAGRILLAGEIGVSYVRGSDAGLIRLRADGSLDRSFGYRGVAITDLGGLHETLSDVAIRPDGRIVATGYSGDYRSFALLAQFEADGSIDESFGAPPVNGEEPAPYVSTGVGWIDAEQDLALDPAGNVVVAGIAGTDVGGPEGPVVERYTAGGELDADFDSDFAGFGDDPDAQRRSEVQSVDVDRSGRLILAGILRGESVDDPEGESAAVTRLNSGGDVDRSYGDDGHFLSASDDRLRSTVATPGPGDGSILLSSRLNPSAASTLRRLTVDGEIDTSFGDGGDVSIADLSGSEVVTTSSGRIVVAGFGLGGDELRGYSADGAPDERFGDSGRVSASGRAIAASEDTILATGEFELQTGLDELVRVGPATEDLGVVGPETVETEITSGPERADGPVDERSATFAFEASEPGATFECRYDVAREFEPCASPRRTGYRLSRLWPEYVYPRFHMFEVRAVGVDGEVDPTPAFRRFEVTPPPARIRAGTARLVDPPRRGSRLGAEPLAVALSSPALRVSAEARVSVSRRVARRAGLANTVIAGRPRGSAQAPSVGLTGGEEAVLRLTVESRAAERIARRAPGPLELSVEGRFFPID